MIAQKQKTKAKKSVLKSAQKGEKISAVKKADKVESTQKSHKVFKIAVWIMLILALSIIGLAIFYNYNYQHSFYGSENWENYQKRFMVGRILLIFGFPAIYFYLIYGPVLIFWNIVLYQLIPCQQKKNQKINIVFCAALICFEVLLYLKFINPHHFLTSILWMGLLTLLLVFKAKNARWYCLYLIVGLVFPLLKEGVDYATRQEVAIQVEDVTGTGCVDKPIIYLYPTEKMDVSVKVGHQEKFVHTYPKYQGGWWVEANPNGDLVDKASGRKLYALYWEGKETDRNTVADTGFVVAGEQTIPFLEEKLARLGLTEREANEFIIYWLPKLEKNNYNFIRFQTKAEQDESMPLMIEPQPDTVIRVMMEYDDLDESVAVNEQILPEKPVRNGFTVVEWGGTEIDID